jgi:P-type conjugative transfer protein TrbG
LGQSFSGEINVRTPIAVIPLIVAQLSFGQQSLPPHEGPTNKPPLEVRREPSGKAGRQPSGPPALILPQYDFGAQLRALTEDGDVGAAGSAKPEFQAPPFKPDVTNSGVAVPKDFRPNPDVPLNPTALEAVRVSAQWRGEKNPPAAGSDGRVLYSFGAGLPTVVCAPLRVCMIELQSGEKIVGEPQIGDSVRWNISPALYGRGEDATAVIVLKPQVPGLDTNLLVTTDRRAYYLRLISKPEEYVARIAFAYPNDENNRKWQEQIAEQRAQAKQDKRPPSTAPAVLTVEKINFSYTVKGGNEHIRPVRVFDDGAKTYIQMPNEMRNREAPVLVVLGADGKGEMTNYRVHEQTYVVDRLFDRANLVLGSGKKAQKVEISRGEPKG